jgi:hypothetical protein
MPFSYVVYKEQRLVISTGSGRISQAEIKERQDQTACDPDFDPEFDQIVDLTAVTDFEMSMDEFVVLARRKVFASRSRRAFVASTPHIFGVGRLWEAHSELSDDDPSKIQVFYDLASALKWLGLEADPR